jgi:serine/threonine protein kinase
MHHDLKPDNLLVTAKNELKIADFGSARWSDAILKSLPKYTPFYASPEVLLSENFDKKCDVFSAGYILY